MERSARQKAVVVSICRLNDVRARRRTLALVSAAHGD